MTADSKVFGAHRDAATMGATAPWVGGRSAVIDTLLQGMIFGGDFLDEAIGIDG